MEPIPTLACAGAEALGGGAGIIVDQNKSFHYDASHRGRRYATLPTFYALVTPVLRRAGAPGSGLRARDEELEKRQRNYHREPPLGQ